MFELGQQVSYIRANKRNGLKFIEGTAIALALVLDAAGRRVVSLHDRSQPEGQERFNVDVKCINASEEFKAAYRETVTAVEARSTEINEEIAKIVASGNGEIDALYSKLLGEPVKLPELRQPSSPGSASNDEKVAA